MRTIAQLRNLFPLVKNINDKAVEFLGVPGDNYPGAFFVAAPLVLASRFFALDLFHLLQGNAISIKGNPGGVGKISNAFASRDKARTLLAPVAYPILRGNPDFVFEFYVGQVLEAAVTDINLIDPSLLRGVALLIAINTVFRDAEIKLQAGSRCQRKGQKQHDGEDNISHQPIMTSAGDNLQEPLGERSPRLLP